jgi:hypothetical protein
VPSGVGSRLQRNKSERVGVVLLGQEATMSLPGPFDREIQQIQERLAAQKALVLRMIARGTPTQAAEDQLRQLEQTLARIKEQHRRSRAANFQRKIGQRSR